jgi:RHS repeat-associated protein
MKLSRIFQSHQLEQSSEHYELGNHLGNVLAVVTDNIHMADDLTTTAVASASDYYPFGLQMDSRTVNEGDYRYGFNGKEKDQDGEFGNTHYDYGFRTYNPAIAKFLSVDPLTSSYPMLTPYQFAGNTPIQAIDLDGLEPIKYDVKNESGNLIRKVIELDIFVLTIEKWNKENGKPVREGKVKKIKSNGRIVRDKIYRLNSTYTADDVISYQNKFAPIYTKNSKGIEVMFKFNVREFHVGENDFVTKSDLTIMSDSFLGRLTDKNIKQTLRPSYGFEDDYKVPTIITETKNVIAKPLILVKGGSDATHGQTSTIFAHINPGSKDLTYLHETFHFIVGLSNDPAHALGGILHEKDPSFSFSPELVDQALKNSIPRSPEIENRSRESKKVH